MRAHYLFERPSQRGGFFYPAGFPSLAKRVRGLKQRLLFLFFFLLRPYGLHGLVSERLSPAVYVQDEGVTSRAL